MPLVYLRSNFFVTFVVGEKLVVHVVLIASQDDGQLVSVVLRNDLEKFKILLFTSTSIVHFHSAIKTFDGEKKENRNIQC